MKLYDLVKEGNYPLTEEIQLMMKLGVPPSQEVLKKLLEDHPEASDHEKQVLQAFIKRA